MCGELGKVENTKKIFQKRAKGINCFSFFANKLWDSREIRMKWLSGGWSSDGEADDEVQLGTTIWPWHWADIPYAFLWLRGRGNSGTSGKL